MFKIMVVVSAMVLSTGAAYSQAKFNFTPNTVPADKKSTLKLDAAMGNPSHFSCASEFPLLETLVKGDQIILRYIHVVRPDVMCTMELDYLGKYAPVFDIPALKAGKYTVLRNETFECLQQTPACKRAEIFDSIGTLEVAASNQFSDDFWYFEPRVTATEKPFTLSLLNPSLGSCHDYFTHQSSSIRGNLINLSFVTRNNPDIVCIADIHPNGPSFDLKGLESGNYNVMITDMPPCSVCEEGVEVCAICEIALIQVYIGTLRVVENNISPVKPTNYFHLKQQMEIAVSNGKINIDNIPFPLKAKLVAPSGKNIPIRSTRINNQLQLSFDSQNVTGRYFLILRNVDNSELVGQLPIHF